MTRGVWIGILLASLSFLSLGKAEDPGWTGRISVKGNEPFAVVALVDDQGRQWTLQGPGTKPLWAQAQGRRVTVFGQANGSHAIVVRSWVWAPDEEFP